MNSILFRSALLISTMFVAMWSSAHQVPQLEFVKNGGQWPSQVQYRVAMQHGAVYMENGVVTYVFADPIEWQKTHDYSQMSEAEKAAFTVPSHAWRMRFIGQSSSVAVGEEVLPHYYNYFHGNDPSQWASKMPAYRAVKYNELYPGIDMRAYSSDNKFKYDFIVAPGANANLIQYEFTGADAIELDNGQLVIHTSVGEFRENLPYSYQLVNGQLKEVACHYALNGNVISFVFPDGYDHNLPLTIDPVLIAATLSGTNITNYGHSATFDLEGNIYTGCISFGAGYPTSDGAFQENFGGGGTDFGISKLDPEGTTLIWASYVGGSQGENPHSMIANNLQELYVYGSTASSNFPVVNGCYDTSHNGGTDIVVVKFSADGTQLLGSTFVGGSGEDGRNQVSVNYGDSYRGEIILDNNQEPLIASFTMSSNFPVSNNAYQNTIGSTDKQDVVAFRLNSSLTILEASTYLGSSEHDTGYAIRQAANGNIYIGGMAGGDDFPITPGAYQTTYLGDVDNQWAQAFMDGFVSCLNSNLSQLLYSTYLATDTQDQIFFLDLDNDEAVYVYGQGGSDMPIVGDVFSVPDSRQFIVKFNPQLSDILVSTQIGAGDGGQWGGFDFVPVAFLVDHCNNIYISSYNAYGDGLPLQEALYSTGGFYLAVFTEDLATLEFATKYSENHVDGGTSRFDKNGTVYQGVCSGGGFTTTPDAWATNQSTGWDVGVFKIDFDVSGVNSAISGSDVVGCAPFQVNFTNFSSGDTFYWDFGDGASSTDYEPSHIYESPGVYAVSLIATDSLSCNIADTSYFDIVISVPVDYAPAFDYVVDCATQSIQCENSTGYDFLSYTWDMGDGTIIEDYDADHTYLTPGTYTITLTAVDEGCLSDSTITQDIVIFDEVIAIIDNDDLEGCAPFDASFQNGGGGISFTWDFGDGSDPVIGNNASHEYVVPGDYTVTLYAMGNTECPGADTTTSLVHVIDPPLIDALFAVQQVDACALMHIQTDNQSIGDDLTYAWYVNGNAEGGNEDISTYLNTPGTYSVVLEISESVCDQTDTYTSDVEVIDEIDLQLQEDMPMCYYEDQVVLQAAEPGPDAVYLWSNGETTSSISVSQPGEYGVQVEWNNCAGVDTVEVTLIPENDQLTQVNFCEGSSTFLTIPFEGSSQYIWCNGLGGQNQQVDQAGEYCYYYIDNFGCTQEGIIEVYMKDFMTTVYVPNAFTPNDDGINDVFKASGIDVAEFQITVWNRWGDEVFTSNDIEQPWTGNSYKEGAHYVQDGIYTYYLTYRGDCSSETIKEVGHLTVVR